MVKIIIAKEDFLWFKKGQIILEKDFQPNWVMFCEVSEDGFKKEELDVNKDGFVDKKDKKVASRIVQKIGKIIPKKKKK